MNPLYTQILAAALQGVIVASAGQDREARHIAWEAREIADATMAELARRSGEPRQFELTPAEQVVGL